ncbi:BRO family protein [Cereibacter johrii]|uniref:BRO-N domain-containing protein n=1 Tax=Cereibacter johrii TaxID=445629 RepID=UPI002B25B38D|nr:BRO family protein [Cereibacter johrii]MEA5159953.1 BRO family protein [Cereibacter johrii]
MCEAIGLTHVANAVRALADDQHMIVERSTNRNLFTFGRGTSRLTLISESGLYKLAGRSDKPQAAAFQDWVTREVLPSIRKTGSYVAPQVEAVINTVAETTRLICCQRRRPRRRLTVMPKRSNAIGLTLVAALGLADAWRGAMRAADGR